MSESFACELRVRYSECDQQGVVFNAHYLTYFDIALTELWRAAIGPYTAMAAGGVDMVVAEATARYRAPARCDDLLRIEVAVAGLGTTSLRTATRVLRGPELLVEGEMRHVFVTIADGAKTAIPDPVRAGLTRYLVAEGPAAGAAARM